MIKFIFSGTKTEVLVCLWNPYKEKTRQEKSVYTFQHKQSNKLNDKNFSQLYSRDEEMCQRDKHINCESKKTKKNTKKY